jgi:hypothetical protein
MRFLRPVILPRAGSSGAWGLRLLAGISVTIFSSKNIHPAVLHPLISVQPSDLERIRLPAIRAPPWVDSHQRAPPMAAKVTRAVFARRLIAVGALHDGPQTNIFKGKLQNKRPNHRRRKINRMPLLRAI